MTGGSPAGAGYVPDAEDDALHARVLAALRSNGWARLHPMAEGRFVALASRMGEIELRTEVRIDAEQAERDRRRRQAGTRPDRPVVYSSGELAFHTDRPSAEVVGWFCVEQDAADGASLLIDTADLPDHFSAREQEDLGRIVLAYGVRDAQTGQEVILRTPLLGRGPLGHALYYAPWQLPADLDHHLLGLLARLDGYLAQKQRTALLRIRLEPGETLFIDNRRLLHARGALPRDSRRHLVRLYLRGVWAARP